MTALLAIDIGTSSTKAALYTTRDELPARYNLSYRAQISQTGWAEQDPFDWWEAAWKCTREIIHAAG